MLSRLEHRLNALLLCGFRPFFLFTSATAVAAMAAWWLHLSAGLPLPPVVGGPMLWHAHEMVFGFGLAALAGFLLTAMPEFTATAAIARSPVLRLALLWLGARVGFLLGGSAGAWIAALCEITLAAALIALTAPRLFADPERRHVSFLWGLVAMLVAVVGFHAESLAGQFALRWLHVAVGVLMVFIVLAMSRISMRIVNEALAARGAEDVVYLARPPRRNLATFCIALYTVVEFVAPMSMASGWIALASAAAMFNLCNDWHVGRALLSRWVLMLYSVYWLIALGYALIGLAVLFGLVPTGAGRHVLMIGAMGLSIFVVLNIAGRIHAGLEPDTRVWVPLAAALLVLSALVRAAVGVVPLPAEWLITIATALWVLPFAIVLRLAWPVYSRPRHDGKAGCAGVHD